MQNVKLQSKIQNFKFLVVIFTFSFFILHFATKAAYGQTLSLGIYPPLLEVMIQPGKSITQVYKLINEGETDLVMTSSVVPFKPADEFGNIQLLPSPYPLIPTNWFSFQNADLALGQKFILKSGKTQEIVLKIGVPKDAKEDDYYLTLLFETTAAAEALGGGGSGTQAQAKIGANILLTVSQTGEPLRSAKIEEFKLLNGYMVKWLNWQFIDSFDKAEFLLRIKNTGKAFFKPQGTITTTGWFNQKYILDLLPENVLVNSVRQISCQSLTKEYPLYPCWLEKRFLLGRYKAKVEFGLDNASGEYTKETIFWAIPAKLILALLTTMFILFIIKSRLKFGET